MLSKSEDEINDMLAAYIQNCKRRPAVREFKFLSGQRADLISYDRDGNLILIESKKLGDPKHLKQSIESAFGQIVRYCSQNTLLSLNNSTINIISVDPPPYHQVMSYVNFLRDSFGVQVVFLCHQDIEKIEDRLFQGYKINKKFISFLSKGNVNARKIVFQSE